MLRQFELPAFGVIASALSLVGSACDGTSDLPRSELLTPAIPQQLSSSAAAISPFEGEIRLEVRRPGESHPMTLMFEINGDRLSYVELDRTPPASSSQVIADMMHARAMVLLPVHNRYVQIDYRVAAAHADGVTVRKTGVTERIAGLKCERWELVTAALRVNTCVAQGIPFVSLARHPSPARQEADWAAFLRGEHVFPLKTTAYTTDGTMLFEAHVTSTDTRPVSDVLFPHPKDFRRVDLAAGMTFPGVS